MKTNRKNAKKKLHKGKRILAKKPLFAAAEHGAITGGNTAGVPTESVHIPYPALKLNY
jgi:hypothetical protein